MENIRFLRANLDIEFSLSENEDFRREFDRMSEVDDDSIGHWLKLAKARGLTQESDTILLTLVTELHRKVDELKSLITDKADEKLKLDKKTFIEKIGFEHFLISEPLFEKGKEYYGRIDMPVFPKRLVPLFFIALDEKTAEFKLMHERDIKDWDSYVTARERVLIREMKAKK